MSDTSGMQVIRLTPDQIAQIAVYREKWLAFGLSTAPTDRQAVETAVDEAYRLAGLPRPRIKMWLASPLQGTIGAYLIRYQLSRHWNQDWHQVRIRIWRQLWHQLEEQVRDQVRSEAQSKAWEQAWDRVRAQVGPWVGDQVRNRVQQQVAR